MVNEWVWWHFTVTVDLSFLQDIFTKGGFEPIFGWLAPQANIIELVTEV